MRKTIRRVVLAVTVAMLLAGMIPVMASARTVKMRGTGFTTSRGIADYSAVPVGMGAVKVKVPKAGGYLKFTAPATRVYSFTVSNVKSSRYCCGYFTLMTPSGLYGTSLTSIRSGLYVASRSRKGSMFLKSRTGYLSLLQGQTAYIYMHFSGKCTVRFRIR